MNPIWILWKINRLPDPKENLNFFDEIRVTTKVNIITNIVEGAKLILGGNSNRVGLGASAKTIGMNKSVPLVDVGDE